MLDISTIPRFWTNAHELRALSTSLLFTFGLSACLGVNTYGYSRTLEPGEYRLLLAVEQFQTDDHGNRLRAVTPGLRMGVAEDIDAGVRLPNLGAISVDLKGELVHGAFGKALDPMASLSAFPGDGTTGLVQVPVLFSFFPGERLSLTATSGIGYGWVHGGQPTNQNTLFDFSGLPDDMLAGPVARFGLGFQVQATKRFSIGPEITMLKAIQEDRVARYYGGIGVHL